MSALDNYRKSAIQLALAARESVESKRANLRKRMVHASKVSHAGRREALLAKLQAEFEELGAVVA